MTTLSVVGLGKLGSPLLAVLANAGFSVIGVDTDEAKVAAINAGKAPVEETDLQEWLDGLKGTHYYKPKFSATTDLRQAVLDSDTTFVIVPTPSGLDGGFVLDYLLPVMTEIGHALRDAEHYHVVVITSTVMPGQTAECGAVLESISGKKLGDHFGLVYSPTFIALGSVIRNLTQPYYAVIGTDDGRAEFAVGDIYNKIIVNGASVNRASQINVEVAKIAQNAFLAMKMAFANDLGRLCEYLPGANADVVLGLLGQDLRIGALNLTAGTAVGGPCLPRDSRALEQVYQRAGVPKTACLSLRELVDIMNDATTEHLWRIVEKEAGDEGVVGVLGLAYKPGTSVCEESASLDLIDHLLMNPHRRVVVYDPLAMDEARKELGCAVEYADSPEDCVAKSDVVVLMFPDAELVPVNAYTREKTLVDPWRAAQPPLTESVLFKYIPLGVGQ